MGFDILESFSKNRQKNLNKLTTGDLNGHFEAV